MPGNSFQTQKTIERLSMNWLKIKAADRAKFDGQLSENTSAMLSNWGGVLLMAVG